MLGLVWLLIWRCAYYAPKHHPRVSEEERQMILADAADVDGLLKEPRPRWFDLLIIAIPYGSSSQTGFRFIW
jgi:hypothetical protein